jgi:ribosomal-protein-alanine N-acetyltransferase
MRLEHACFNEHTREPESVYLERIECFPDGFMILENKADFIGAVSSEIWQRHAMITPDKFSLGHSIKGTINLSGNELYISSIGVLPEYRNKGYSEILFRNLVDNVMKKFENIKYVILFVNEKWTHARKIYGKYGFYEVAGFEGVFTEDDGSKSNGIVMRHDNIGSVRQNWTGTAQGEGADLPAPEGEGCGV